MSWLLWRMLNLNNWKVIFLPQAEADRKSLDGSVKKQVDKAILKVRENPLPVSEGGYGKPLGNKSAVNLTGLLKVKLKASGIRIVYQLLREAGMMKIIIIGVREDDEVYREAAERMKRLK